ncbi:hypothetical protein V6N11_051084 [Hibiscus sabdariffa]|uniref:Uncharacterized protein n=1 Tax=Hibiscus sabdariffa TaxID=183260 RepID=A0ABR2R2X6_9ROSI
MGDWIGYTFSGAVHGECVQVETSLGDLGGSCREVLDGPIRAIDLECNGPSLCNERSNVEVGNQTSGCLWDKGGMIYFVEFIEDVGLMDLPDSRNLVMWYGSGNKGIRLDKSCVYNVSLTEEVVDSVAQVLGYGMSALPFTYLGLSVGIDSRSKAMWDPLVHQIRSLLDGWKS